MQQTRVSGYLVLDINLWTQLAARQPVFLTSGWHFATRQHNEHTVLLLCKNFDYWFIRCAIVGTGTFRAAGSAAVAVAAVCTVAGTVAGIVAGTAAGTGWFLVAAEQTASPQFYLLEYASLQYLMTGRASIEWGADDKSTRSCYEVENLICLITVKYYAELVFPSLSPRGSSLRTSLPSPWLQKPSPETSWGVVATIATLTPALLVDLSSAPHSMDARPVIRYRREA